MLSAYAGQNDWRTFLTNQSTTEQQTKKKKNSFILILGLIILTGLVLAYLIPAQESTFTFCFLDKDREQPILDITLDILILNEDTFPERIKTDSLGCFQWKTTDDYIKFVVQSPYHKTDTIYRKVTSTFNKEIQLATDDYNLMLHYYANGNVKDWKRRRTELRELVDDKAIILQILPYDLGVEVYSKNAFINKLTTPTQSLKDFTIISSKKEDGKIVKLKFKTSL